MPKHVSQHAATAEASARAQIVADLISAAPPLSEQQVARLRTLIHGLGLGSTARSPRAARDAS